MNGPHDLGGQMGFGPVMPETDEPVFHAAWEKRSFALTLAMGALGQWSLDQSRQARERIPPALYLAASYYEIWAEGLLRLLRERGLISDEELANGTPDLRHAARLRPLRAAEVSGRLSRGSPSARPAPGPKRFSPGDRVRTRNIHPEGHTRLPRYARARTGEIVLVHGAHVFPDSNTAGKGEDPQWLYTVRFSARELWGEDRNPRDCVYIDLWEPYLERA